MRTVVITGGTEGIGRGFARTRLGCGDRVVTVGTDKAEAESGASFLHDRTREVLAR